MKRVILLVTVHLGCAREPREPAPVAPGPTPTSLPDFHDGAVDAVAVTSPPSVDGSVDNGTKEKFTSSTSNWTVELELDYLWAAETNPGIDRLPAARNAQTIAADLGPYHQLIARLSSEKFSKAWGGSYEVVIDAEGRVRELNRWATGFRFSELDAMEARLRTLTFTPALRGTTPRSFTCWLGVDLRPRLDQP